VAPDYSFRISRQISTGERVEKGRFALEFRLPEWSHFE